MILNIFVIVFLLGMTILWSTYGFFSAFVNLLVAAVAGLLAFACWEPVAYWLLGMGWSSAWGIGLFLPYLVFLALLRVAAIKVVRKNVGFHPLVDQVGGGALGLAAGVLTAGVLVIGAGHMMTDTELLGVQPYRLGKTGQVEKNDKGHGLWVPVDAMAGGLFESLAGGAFSPLGSDLNLASEYPDLARHAAAHRVAVDPTATRIASPEGVTVTAAYSLDYSPEAVEWLLSRASAYAVVRQAEVDKIPSGYDRIQTGNWVSDSVAALLKDDKDPAKEYFDAGYMAHVRKYLGADKDLPGEIVLQRWLAYAVDQVPGGDIVIKAPPERKLFAANMAGKKLVLVETEWDKAKSNAYDEGALRLSPNQIQLCADSGKKGGGVMFQPVAWSAPMLSSPLFNRRELLEITEQNPGMYGTMAKEGSPDKLAFLFAVPKGNRITSIRMRGLRFLLGGAAIKPVAVNLSEPGKTTPEAKEMAKLLGHILPAAPKNVGLDAPDKGTPTVGTVATHDGVVEWTARLPNIIDWSNPPGGLDILFKEDKKDMKLIKGTFNQEKALNMGRTNLRMNRLLLPPNRVCARLKLTLPQCQAIWGRQMDTDRGNHTLRLRGMAGPLSSVGFVVIRSTGASSVHIDCNEGLPVDGKTLSALRPIFGSKDMLYVYYFVDELDTVDGFGLYEAGTDKAVKDRQYDFPKKVPMKSVRMN